MSDNGDPKTLGGVGRDGVAEEILRQAQMRCGWEGSDVRARQMCQRGRRITYGCDTRKRPWLLWEQLDGEQEIDRKSW